jgi:hypothetical protein
VGALQDAISKKQIPVEVVTVTAKLPEVLKCIERPGGMCTAGAAASLHVSRDVCATLRSHTETQPALATQAICDPTAASLEEIMNAAAGRQIDDKVVSLSRDQSRGFAKTLFDAANTRSWRQVNGFLQRRAEALDTKAAGKPDANLSQDERDEARSLTTAIRLTDVLQAYYSDYFDGGHFVSLTIDPNHAKASAEQELESKLGLSASSAQDAVNDALDQIKSLTLGPDNMYHLISAKSDGGFVSRSGDKYQVPSVTVTVTPGANKAVNVSKVDFTAVGADVMRVFVEAVGDYWAQLPGVAGSSGVKMKLLRVYGQDPAKEQVDATQFKEVNDWSSSAETAAAGATGQLIRGIGWVSLNNEALAKVIETAIGVAARKASEKVTWCVEACAKVADRISFDAGAVTTSTTHVQLVE